MNSPIKDIKPVAWIRASELSLLANYKCGLGTHIAHSQTAPEQAPIFDTAALEAARAAGFAECREMAKAACETERSPFDELNGEDEFAYEEAITMCVEAIAALQPAEQKEPM